MSFVKFLTVGCKVNQYETQALREILLNNGYEETDEFSKADCFVINTCTVTSKADRDSRRFIHKAHKASPDAEIVVTGCLTERDENEIRSIPGLTRIVKNSEKHKIADFFRPVARDPRPMTHDHLQISDFRGHSRAFVKIQDGCDNSCSYCKVPLVRGRSRSRNTSDILEEISRLVNKGFKEIVLCGICLGAWGRDSAKKTELADLLDSVDSIKGDFRVRLSSIEPKHVTERVIKKIAGSPRFCNHLHIPLQSGDDFILQAMNRPYKSRDFVKLIKGIRSFIPDFSLTTDVLAGFPGEGSGHFRNTLRVLKQTRPLRVHAFAYSNRPGTLAQMFKNAVSIPDIKSRVSRLVSLSDSLSYTLRRRLIKKTVRALVETKRDKSTQLLTGYTDAYVKILLDGPDSLAGQLVNVKIIKVDPKTTFCKNLH